MSRAERLDYIRAVKCLHTRPPKTDSKLAPGCKNRYDDFVVAHIMNTYNVHFSPWLLSFHRVFIWEFEKALRNECGYKGGKAINRMEALSNRGTNQFLRRASVLGLVQICRSADGNLAVVRWLRHVNRREWTCHARWRRM